MHLQKYAERHCSLRWISCTIWALFMAARAGLNHPLLLYWAKQIYQNLIRRGKFTNFYIEDHSYLKREKIVAYLEFEVLNLFFFLLAVVLTEKNIFIYSTARFALGWLYLRTTSDMNHVAQELLMSNFIIPARPAGADLIPSLIFFKIVSLPIKQKNVLSHLKVEK